jgi:outer membrane receptor for ferrienterochelin and colicin
MPNFRLKTGQAASCVLLAAIGAQAGAADLDSLSMKQLMQIEVVGASKYGQKQDAVAAAVSVITRQEIIAFGWRTLDEALASLPGVYTTYDRQYSYLGMRAPQTGRTTSSRTAEACDSR